MSKIENTPPPQKRGRNWTRIALIGSLAVNLLIVGTLAGAFWKHEKPKGRHMDRISMGLGANILALPEPAQGEIAALVGKGFESRRAFRRIMRDSQKELLAALRAEPFSEEVLRAAFEAHRGAALGKSRVLQDAYVDALVDMSDEERAAHLDRAEQIRKKKEN